jgi:multidrug efflux pump
VIFGVPAGVLGAILFVWGRDITNDVYTNIGLIMLIGLIAQNAILIVEFARQQRSEGKSIFDASVEAAQRRLCPSLMTSFAFILGVVPLALSTGAGAASRVSLGTAVIGGMLVGTVISIFVVPAFYYVFQRLVEWRRPAAVVIGAGASAVMHAGDGSAVPTSEPEHTETPIGERR